MFKPAAVLSILLLSCYTLPPALAQDEAPAAETKTHEQTLADAGLSLNGTTFVLNGETEIVRGRRDITLAQRELSSAERDFRDAENKIARAQQYIAALQRELDEIASRARRADDQNEFDRYVRAHQEKVREIEQAQEERKQFEQQQQTKIDDAKAVYIETMYAWVEKGKAVVDQYAELAEDQAVAAAIEAASQERGRKLELGPSRAFQNVWNELSKAAEEYQRGAVDLRKEGNVLLIDVRLNGQPIRTLILDTGASTVSLPFLFAKDLGINPDENTPQVQLQMADGKIVDAWQMRLETVQVGEFIVHDVECVVLPEDLHAAPALLGNSFLKNFTFEVDPERGKLILSRLKKQE